MSVVFFGIVSDGVKVAPEVNETSKLAGAF